MSKRGVKAEKQENECRRSTALSAKWILTNNEVSQSVSVHLPRDQTVYTEGKITAGFMRKIRGKKNVTCSAESTSFSHAARKQNNKHFLHKLLP